MPRQVACRLGANINLRWSWWTAERVGLAALASFALPTALRGLKQHRLREREREREGIGECLETSEEIVHAG